MMEWGWVEASCRGASRLVGEGANEGGGPGTGTRGGKRPRGGREHGRLRLIRGRPPSSLSSFSLPPFRPPCGVSLSRRRPSLSPGRVTTSRIHCALLLVLFLSAAISCPFGSLLISIVANSMPRRPVVSPP